MKRIITGRKDDLFPDPEEKINILFIHFRENGFHLKAALAELLKTIISTKGSTAMLNSWGRSICNKRNAAEI